MFDRIKIGFLLWVAAVFFLIFTVFLSFSSENAGPSFYKKFYMIQAVLCAGSLTPIIHEVFFCLSRRLLGLASFVVFAIYLGLWNYMSSGDPFYSLVVWVVMLVGFSVYWIAKVRGEYLLRIVCSVIWVNMFFLFIQYLYYIYLGEVPYFHGDLFSFSRDKYQLVVGGSYYRFSGLQLEPGSYSTMLALALIFYYSLKRRVDLTFCIGSISVCLTFSMVGLVYFLILLLVIIFQVRLTARNFLTVIVVSILFVAGAYGKIVSIGVERFGRGYEGDSSLKYKANNLIAYSRFDFIEYITGLGLEQVSDRVSGGAYVKSNGAFFYCVYTMGLIGGLGMIFMLFRAVRNGPTCVAFTVILLLCRYPLIYPVFWLLAAVLWNFRANVTDGKCSDGRGSQLELV